jgi:pimeloyl-ACP methyl ester carboxylesterase
MPSAQDPVFASVRWQDRAGIGFMVLALALLGAPASAAPPCDVPDALAIPNVYHDPLAGELNGRTKAVVIAHGVNSSPDAWVRDLANFNGEQPWVGLQNSWIAALGAAANQWDVWGLDWREGSTGSAIPATRQVAAAYLQGQFVAKKLLAANRTHVHLVAHSLGGRVIETAATILRQAPNAPAVHTTFLDAYTPPFWEFVFGSTSTWSDHYYNYGSALALDDPSFTQSNFSTALNVNVTHFQLPKPEGYGTFWGHAWPIHMYRDTIRSFGSSPYGGYGYPYSLEALGAGNWPNLDPPPGTEVVLAPLGNVTNPPIPAVCAHQPNAVSVDLTAANALCAQNDGVELAAGTLRFAGSEPMFANVVLRLTKPANFIRFEYKIASEIVPNSQLLVYYDSAAIKILKATVVTLLYAAESRNRLDQFVSTGLLMLPLPLSKGDHVIQLRWEPNVVDLGNLLEVRNIEAGMWAPPPGPPAQKKVMGKKLGMKDDPDPSRPDRLVYIAKDDTLPPPTRLGADDPTIQGASFIVRNPVTFESVTYDLPALDDDTVLWKVNRAGTVFRYKNPRAPQGPSAVKTATLKAGILKVKVQQDLQGFSLNESQQQVLETVFVSGSTQWCSRFDAPSRDEGGVFSANDAPAPAACDTTFPTTTTLPVCPTTTSTTSTTSTTL